MQSESHSIDQQPFTSYFYMEITSYIEQHASELHSGSSSRCQQISVRKQLHLNQNQIIIINRYQGCCTVDCAPPLPYLPTVPSLTDFLASVMLEFSPHDTIDNRFILNRQPKTQLIKAAQPKDPQVFTALLRKAWHPLGGHSRAK